MTSDDRDETITDRAAISDSADEREPERVCCDGGHANFPPLPDDPETTPEQRAGLDEVLAKVWPDPAPGATVGALDLDAIVARALAFPEYDREWHTDGPWWQGDENGVATGDSMVSGFERCAVVTPPPPLHQRLEPVSYVMEHIAGMDPATTLALVAEVRSLLAKVAAVEALAERLAASLALVLYDAHPIYGSTALWHGGIGGQTITAHCAIIHGSPPGMEWTESDLPSMALREFITASPGFDLDAAKAAMLADLRAALATGEGK